MALNFNTSTTIFNTSVIKKKINETLVNLQTKDESIGVQLQSVEINIEESIGCEINISEDQKINIGYESLQYQEVSLQDNTDFTDDIKDDIAKQIEQKNKDLNLGQFNINNDITNLSKNITDIIQKSFTDTMSSIFDTTIYQSERATVNIKKLDCSTGGGININLDQLNDIISHQVLDSVVTKMSDDKDITSILSKYDLKVSQVNEGINIAQILIALAVLAIVFTIVFTLFPVISGSSGLTTYLIPIIYIICSAIFFALVYWKTFDPAKYAIGVSLFIGVIWSITQFSSKDKSGKRKSLFWLPTLIVIIVTISQIWYLYSQTNKQKSKNGHEIILSTISNCTKNILTVNDGKLVLTTVSDNNAPDNVRWIISFNDDTLTSDSDITLKHKTTNKYINLSSDNKNIELSDNSTTKWKLTSKDTLKSGSLINITSNDKYITIDSDSKDNCVIKINTETPNGNFVFVDLNTL